MWVSVGIYDPHCAPGASPLSMPTIMVGMYYIQAPMIAGLQLHTAPATEPLTVAEVKARLRITISDEDSDLAALLAECRELCERECQRAFITQTWTLYLDDFPRGGDLTIYIPRPPLISVTHLKYYDVDGVQQTYGASNYHVAAGGEPGRIVRVDGGVWPAIDSGRPESVEVRFVCGYGAAGAVPAAAKNAILVVMASLRENPGSEDNKSARAGIPAAARRALDSLEYGEIR